MKIKLTKDHVSGKAGDVVEVEQGRANYLIRVGAGEEYAEAKPVAKKKAPAKNKSASKKKKNAKG